MTIRDETWLAPDDAVAALAALAQETRLAVFRMLVGAGPEGLTAGAVAGQAGVPPSTLSHHLATLERAGLVHSERESRLVRYRADFPAMRRLIDFLTDDCCGGHPELCGPFSGGCGGGEGA